MHVIIIEDEIPSQEKLVSFLKRYNPELEIIGKAEKLREADHLLESNKADLIFADIELLDGNIFEVLKGKKINTPIIFTTSYNDYLQQAFDVNGISYLLKPYSYNQFENSMDKFSRLFDQSIVESFIKEISTSTKKYKERLLVKLRNEMRILQVSDIRLIRMSNGIIYAHKADSKYIVEERTLAEILSQLNPLHFYRINRAEIINANYIEKIEAFGKERLAIKLQGFEEFFTSSSNRTPNLRKWLRGI